MNQRYNAPTSRSRSFALPGCIDLAWAFAAPMAAFWLRDPKYLAADHIYLAASYAGVAVAVSILIFQWFSISDAMSRYFSNLDAFNVAKACIVVAALSAAINFAMPGPVSPPRSIPVIHLLLLAAGLVTGRALARLREWRRTGGNIRRRPSENIIIVNATRLAWLYTKMVDDLSRGEIQIVAIVDEREHLVGRALCGHRIAGTPLQLADILDEYKVHGIDIQRIVVAGDRDGVSRKAWSAIERATASDGVELEILPQRLGLTQAAASTVHALPVLGAPSQQAPGNRTYWSVKRCLDVVFALIMLTLLAPVVALVLPFVICDVGFPVLFWQQRLGRRGQRILVYKLRTLRAPFDRRGRPLAEDRRLSAIGRLLRATRIDEIPQLISILLGDMSLIGPRPLLPIDQPDRIELRLSVPPGLTGWAQVNGGKLLTTQEKCALDEWYIRNVSFWLDVKILIHTALMVVRGDRRGDAAIRAAFEEAAGLEAKRPAQRRPQLVA